MGKMTGLEPVAEIPSKVLAIYGAVHSLIGEGRDMNDISVSAITKQAGIGKGTAYDYFESKEEMIACAFLFYISNTAKNISQILKEKSTLRRQMEFIFEQLEQDNRQKISFVCFMHGATDNSKYSQIIREKILLHSVDRNFPDFLLGDLVREDVRRGEIAPNLPVEYVVFSIFCKVFNYMMCLETHRCFDINQKQMKELIIEGILKELQNPES